jgi:hypothetical protein
MVDWRKNPMSGIEIVYSDHHGIYIPKLFSEQCGGWGVSHEDVVDLADPENEFYWDTWSNVLDYATLKDENGNLWRLWQDGDLFAYCEELMSDEEYKNFFGEER